MAGDQPPTAAGGFVRWERASPGEEHKAQQAKAWPHPLLRFRPASSFPAHGSPGGHEQANHGFYSQLTESSKQTPPG